MEPDDLLCSRNARSRTPLVGRAQWKINQASSLRRQWANLERICLSPDAGSEGQPGNSPKERTMVGKTVPPNALTVRPVPYLAGNSFTASGQQFRTLHRNGLPNVFA
jgi:hypothetical protein